MSYTGFTTDELLSQKQAIESELLGRIDEELRHIEERRTALLSMKPVPAKKKRGKSTLPAKYRNPTNPEQTWTGRGKPPAWMAGLDRDSCLIQ